MHWLKLCVLHVEGVTFRQSLEWISIIHSAEDFAYMLRHTFRVRNAARLHRLEVLSLRDVVNFVSLDVAMLEQYVDRVVHAE